MSVGIVILTKGNVSMLIDCLQSIKNNTNIDYKIYIGDTGSTQDELDRMIVYLKSNFTKEHVHLHKFNRYNFAACNNYIVNNFTDEEYILLCNNDIELLNNSIDIMYDKITTMDNVGTVGCRLEYPGTHDIQHAGQIVGIIRNPFSLRAFLTANHRGLNTKNKYKDWEQVVGNTGGFMMVKRSLYLEVGGLNERYQECFEDVEFNLEMIKRNYKNMYTDTARCIHRESVSRGKSKTLSLTARKDHGDRLTPYFNSLDYETKNNILNISKDSMK